MARSTKLLNPSLKSSCAFEACSTGNVSSSAPGTNLNSSSASGSEPSAARTSSRDGAYDADPHLGPADLAGQQTPVIRRSPLPVSRRYHASLRSSSAFSIAAARKLRAAPPHRLIGNGQFHHLANSVLDSLSMFPGAISVELRRRIFTVDTRSWGGPFETPRPLESGSPRKQCRWRGAPRRELPGRDRSAENVRVPTDWSRPAFLR